MQCGWGGCMKVFRELAWFFLLEKKSYLYGILTLIVVALLILLPPYIIGVLIDGIVQGNLEPGTMISWLAVMVITGLLLYGLRYVWRILIFGSAAKLGQLLRNRLYIHFTRLSPRFYQQKKTGDLMAHATNDILAVEHTAGEGVLTLADSLIMGISVIVAMSLFIDWKLTAVSLLPLPLIALSTGFYGRLLHERFHHAQASFSALNDKVQENISAVKVVRAFGQEEAEEKSFRLRADGIVRSNMAVAKVDALFDPTISLLVGLSYFLAVAYGAGLVIDQTISLGELTQFTIYLGQLIWPMLAIGYLINITERGRASYERISDILNRKPDVSDRPGALAELPAGPLQVQLESFTYPGHNHPALQGISFTLEKGQTLGIVGKTGSGKSTLLRLMLREYDVSDGEISIGGQAISSYRLNSLREAIGYVPQDHILFSATIAENIAFGRPDAERSEIEAAARMAAVHKDIVNFPQGYETMVGERGVTLSGGQKQRLSIARALLLKPRLLLLDDCLSAVDASTETAVLESLAVNRGECTTIIAAHRLSVVEKADWIIVLEEGKLVEQGHHRRLLEAGERLRRNVQEAAVGIVDQASRGWP